MRFARWPLLLLLLLLGAVAHLNQRQDTELICVWAVTVEDSDGGRRGYWNYNFRELEYAARTVAYLRSVDGRDARMHPKIMRARVLKP